MSEKKGKCPNCGGPVTLRSSRKSGKLCWKCRNWKTKKKPLGEGKQIIARRKKKKSKDL